jgi:hypothetical protein
MRSVDSDGFTGCEVNGDSSIDTTARLIAPAESVSFDRRNDRGSLLMEEIVYYGVIAAMIGFGLYAGNRWARSMGEAVLFGLVGSTIAVAMFLCLIVVHAMFSPTGHDPTETTVRLGALLLFGSALGPVSAIGGRRRAEKAARLF